jgi:hypothetical protein
MQDLYTNYDCDVQCSNMFDEIITVLCTRSYPPESDSRFKRSSSAYDLISPSDKSSSLNLANLSTTNKEQTTSVSGKNGSLPAKVSGRLTLLNKLSLCGVLSVLHAVALRLSSSIYVSPEGEEFNSEGDKTKVGRSLSSSTDVDHAFPVLDGNNVDSSTVSPSKVVTTVEQQVDQWCETSETGHSSPSGSVCEDQNDTPIKSVKPVNNYGTPMLPSVSSPTTNNDSQDSSAFTSSLSGSSLGIRDGINSDYFDTSAKDTDSVMRAKVRSAEVLILIR